MHVIIALGIALGILTIVVQRHQRRMLELKHRQRMELLQESKSVVEVLMLVPDQAREVHGLLGEAIAKESNKD